MLDRLPSNLRASVVIRCNNERKTIEDLLNILFEQTMMSFELIIIDNNSTDGTLEIIKDYPISKIIHIPKNEFNHAYSCNLGISSARTNFVVLTNGHCIQISRTWLEDGLSNFIQEDVAAVDGNYRARCDASKWERLADIWQAETLNIERKNIPISTTNAIIRRDLWLSYPFDEELDECEDYDWSQEMIARGFCTIKDPRFNVYHSHGLLKNEIEEQVTRWGKFCRIIDSRKRPRKSHSRIFDANNWNINTIMIEELL